MSNLALDLAATARRIPDHPATITDAATKTYAELHAASARFATLLQRNGIGAGDPVEEALHEHRSVAQAVVIGIPHDSLGEEVGAAVVLNSGATTDPTELKAFAKQRVAAYKYPRRVWLVEILPTGPTGKLLRREVTPPPEEV